MFSLRQRLRIGFFWRYLRRQMPWDTGITPPEVVDLATKLPPGKALDLGCGTGTSSLYLAAHGWQVVGVDFVGIAIRQAKRKARSQRLTGRMQFYTADASQLDFLNPAFNLVLDIGCFHSLTPDQQAGYARHITRLAAPGAAFALYAFAPRLLNGRPIGVTPEDVARIFAPGYTLAEVAHGQDKSTGPASAWYLLRRV